MYTFNEISLYTNSLFLYCKGFTVTAITDIKPDNCKGYPESIAVKGSAREVAEMSDIVVSPGLPNIGMRICIEDNCSGVLEADKRNNNERDFLFGPP